MAEETPQDQLNRMAAQLQQLQGTMQSTLGNKIPSASKAAMPKAAMPAAAAATPGQDVKPLTPEQQLKVLMSAESWAILQGLLHWAIVWESVRKGEKLEYNENTKSVMMAPWTFFGASPATLSNLFQYITPSFMNALGQYEADEIYAAANPMPWIVLQSAAPMYALIDRGRQAQMQVWEVIKELRKADTLPIEQGLAA